MLSDSYEFLLFFSQSVPLEKLDERETSNYLWHQDQVRRMHELRTKMNERIIKDRQQVRKGTVTIDDTNNIQSIVKVSLYLYWSICQLGYLSTNFSYLSLSSLPLPLSHTHTTLSRSFICTCPTHLKGSHCPHSFTPLSSCIPETPIASPIDAFWALSPFLLDFLFPVQKFAAVILHS